MRTSLLTELLRRRELNFYKDQRTGLVIFDAETGRETPPMTDKDARRCVAFACLMYVCLGSLLLTAVFMK